MGYVLQAGILMIMLTCGFGVGVTPMVGSLLAQGTPVETIMFLIKGC
jgi:hypothetical protein